MKQFKFVDNTKGYVTKVADKSVTVDGVAGTYTVVSYAITDGAIPNTGTAAAVSSGAYEITFVFTESDITTVVTKGVYVDTTDGPSFVFAQGSVPATVAPGTNWEVRLTSTFLNTISDYVANTTLSRNIGEVYAYTGTDVPAGGLRANGQTLLNCDQMFPEFYTWVLANGIRGTLAEYAAALTAYDDQCGFFGVDETAKTVRLPRITQFIGGTVDVSAFGSAQLAGLPNITGTLNCLVSARWDINAPYGYGALNWGEPTAQVTGYAYGDLRYGFDPNFDASRSSPVYGRSTTVTPANVRYPYLIHVYNAAVPASVAQATTFNNAVDSLRSDVPAMAASAAMPGTKSIALPATPNTALYYTPTSPGYLSLRIGVSGYGFVYAQQNSTIKQNAAGTNAAAMITVPVIKNIPIEYGLYGTVVNPDISADFIYAEGAQ